MVALEALMLAALGLAAGVALGHALTGLIGLLLHSERSLAITGWWWSTQHLGLAALAMLLAVAASAWPLWRVWRLPVTTLLQDR